MCLQYKPFENTEGQLEIARYEKFLLFQHDLAVVSSIPVEANFPSGIFSPLTSAEASEKRSRWLWKEKLCWYWCEKARKYICVTNHHDMTLAVNVALNPNTTNITNFRLFQTERDCRRRFET